MLPCKQILKAFSSINLGLKQTRYSLMGTSWHTGSRTTYQPRPFFFFPCFSLSNVQTKVQMWTYSQGFRIPQNWNQPYSHWDNKFFIMAVLDKVENAIQTVCSRIAALKQKVEVTGGKSRGSYFIKKNCIKLTFSVQMKLKLPLNQLFPPQLVSAADKLQSTHLFTCCIVRKSTAEETIIKLCIRLWLLVIPNKNSCQGCAVHCIHTLVYAASPHCKCIF